MKFDISHVTKALVDEANNNADDFGYYEEGVVLSVEDGIVRASGLSGVMLSEIVRFENGARGMTLNLEQKQVGIVMLSDYTGIKEGQKVFRTNKVFEISVGDEFLGRVINALGDSIDGKGPISSKEFLPIEKIAPGVMARKSVDQPLVTGILSIDAMFPIGRGQRELIIGDRQTGKTTVATDTIINQRENGVYCVYVTVGQKNSSVAALVANLEAKGAMEYTTVVSATASELPALQYMAPYVGVTLAEYWMSKGKDVLIVYDDLSKHAIAYRTLSLLLRRPPGREAYPGDVFYLHSRLLERACRVNEENGGGSITALPIIETQAGDISAYIPTNVISITDGQIFMMTSLFNSGQRPAIDAGLSVSRVGGAAQIKSIKQMGASMKLELANYRELDAFSQFGSELDAVSKKTLEHGKRILQLLRQTPNNPYNQTDEAIILFAIKEGFVDQVATERMIEYREYFLKQFHKEPYIALWHDLTNKKAFEKDANILAFKHAFKMITKDFLDLIQYLPEEEEDVKRYGLLLDKLDGEKDAYDEIRRNYETNPVAKQILNEDLKTEKILLDSEKNIENESKERTLEQRYLKDENSSSSQSMPSENFNEDPENFNFGNQNYTSFLNKKNKNNNQTKKN